MPIHTHTIAALNSGGTPIALQTYQFVDMVGIIQLATTTIEVIQRPYLGTSLFRRTPRHGQPTTLVTTNYVLNWSTAAAAMAAYDALKEVDYGVRIVKNTITYTDPAVVLHVEEVEPPRAVTSVVGSLVANAQILQRVRWTLMFP